MNLRRNISAAFPKTARKPRKVRAGQIMRANTYNALVAAVLALQEANR